MGCKSDVSSTCMIWDTKSRHGQLFACMVSGRVALTVGCSNEGLKTTVG